MRAQRSRYFGPGSFTIASAKPSDHNLESDFFWKSIIDRRLVEKLLARKLAARPGARTAARSPRLGRGLRRLPATRSASRGSPTRAAAARLGQADHRRSTPGAAPTSSPCCAVAPSSPSRSPPRRPATAARAARTPRAVSSPRRRAGGRGRCARPADRLERHRPRLPGHQGRRRDAARQPALPVDRAERFYQFQLTLPGKLDVQGSSLGGPPVVNIGFNRHVAWTHTVSTGVAVHADPARPRPRLPDLLPLRRQDPQAHLPHGQGADQGRRRPASTRSGTRASATLDNFPRPATRGTPTTPTRWVTPTPTTCA